MSKAQHTPDHKCCETVYPKTGIYRFHGHSCGKPAKYQDEKGNWFCGFHSPEAKARKIEKREQRWAEQDAERERRYEVERRERICVQACEGISTDALEDGVVKELLEALEMVTKQYQLVRDADSGFDGIPSKAIAKANAILAKAKGE